MARQAITFDFHNTLVHCDDWFALEVRELPAAFTRWHAERHGPLVNDVQATELTVSYRALRQAIIEHGNELTAEQSLAAIFDQHDIQVADLLIAEGVRELMACALPQASAVAGAVGIVRELHGRGIPLGVVSSAVYHPFLEWALDGLGIHGCFETVVTSASCGYYKSRPEIYWHTLAAMNADSTTSLHIGDSLRFDVAGARRAGMRTVWLDPNATSDPEHVPDLTVATLEGAVDRIVETLYQS